jgi:hypothetical protein
MEGIDPVRNTATADLKIEIYDDGRVRHVITADVAPRPKVYALINTPPLPVDDPPPVIPITARVIPFAPEAAAPRRRGFWPGTYAEYTATPEFRAIAAAARKDWGYRCLMNTNHHGPVEMHHRNYSDVPFREDWHTLIPLCEECHERYHNRLPKPPPGMFDDHELKWAA